MSLKFSVNFKLVCNSLRNIWLELKKKLFPRQSVVKKITLSYKNCCLYPRVHYITKIHGKF